MLSTWILRATDCRDVKLFEGDHTTGGKPPETKRQTAYVQRDDWFRYWRPLH